jgi:hypothetical protein
MGNVIGMQREVCEYIEPLVGIQLDTDLYQVKKKASVQLSHDHFFERVDEVPST